MATAKYKAIPHLTERDLARFKSKIGPINERGCREWTCHKNPRGYGLFQLPTGSFRASRIAVFLKTGIDPMGLSVKHSCDNPPCVDDEHLSTGTHAENMAEMSIRGRSPRGEANYRAKLTECDVLSIRERFKSRTGSMRQFAKDHGIGYSHLQEIVRRNIWKHI